MAKPVTMLYHMIVKWCQ